jgi:hypothetical protein
MTNQFTHVADIKVGSVKGKSRAYPQLRLPSQYVELAGKKASIYEISEHEGDPIFIIRFDGQYNVAAYHGATQRSCVANGREVPVKPFRNCRDHLYWERGEQRKRNPVQSTKNEPNYGAGDVCICIGYDIK